MAAPMSDRTNHRRALCFAVTGVLLGGAGCTSNEPAKTEIKPETKAKQPEPVGVGANEGPVEAPPPEPVPLKRVNPGPEPEPKPQLKVNPGPER
jgi:hypothetical protein